MIKTITILAFLITPITINSQTIYSKAYGNPKNEPIIYLHGGPGYNSIGFELTTAKKMSKNGFYVVVYDRRGEGRSKDKNAKFTFQETFKDLTIIYKKYNLKKATLFGHSFGGIIGTLFAEKYPEKAKKLILVAAPLSMQETFLNIIKTSKSMYIKNGDKTNLKYIEMLEKMDTTSIAYSSYSFGHAMQNGFYTPKTPSKEALAIYSKLKTDASFIKDGATMTMEAPRGFLKNENYTSIDLTLSLKKILKNNTQIFGLYGKEDGLYSKEQVLKIKNILPLHHFKYMDNCSHNVFIDQQDKLITSLKQWLL